MLNIERILKEKGMTQRDLADRLGVSVQAVNAAVRGRSNPSRGLLCEYARSLGVTIEMLYDDFLKGS